MTFYSDRIGYQSPMEESDKREEAIAQVDTNGNNNKRVKTMIKTLIRSALHMIQFQSTIAVWLIVFFQHKPYL